MEAIRYYRTAIGDRGTGVSVDTFQDVKIKLAEMNLSIRRMRWILVCQGLAIACLLLSVLAERQGW